MAIAEAHSEILLRERLMKSGVPSKYLDRGMKGFAEYVSEQKSHQLPAVIAALIPGPDEFQGPLQNQCRDALTWVKWAMFQGEPQEVLAAVGHGSPRGVCGSVFTSDGIAYNCRTCEHNPDSWICALCFQNGNHDAHDFSMLDTSDFSKLDADPERSMFNPVGLCCGCGDVTAWKESGFCPSHCGLGQVPPLPSSLRESATPVLEALFLHWVNVLKEANTASNKWDSQSVQEKDVACQLSAVCIEMLLEFCSFSDAMLTFIAELVGQKSLGLLDTLMETAQGFLPETCWKLLEVLLIKLLGVTNFKHAFALSFVSHYSFFLHEVRKEDISEAETGSYRGRINAIFRRFNLKRFSYPELTLQLMKESDFLDVLLGILKEFFCASVQEDGILSMRTGRVYAYIFHDISDIMTRHIRYVAQERPKLLEDWLHALYNVFLGEADSEFEVNMAEECFILLIKLVSERGVVGESEKETAHGTLLQLPAWSQSSAAFEGKLGQLFSSVQVHDFLHAIFFHATGIIDTSNPRFQEPVLERRTTKFSTSPSFQRLLLRAFHVLALALDVCEHQSRRETEIRAEDASSSRMPLHGVKSNPNVQVQPPLLVCCLREGGVVRLAGSMRSQHESMLALLAKLLRNRGSDQEGEPGSNGFKDLIKRLLRRFADLDPSCLYEIESLAPEILPDRDISASEFEKRKTYFQKRDQPHLMESSDFRDALHDASGTSVPSQMPSSSKFSGAVGRSWGCSDSKSPWNPDPSNIDMTIPSSDPFRYHPLQQQDEIRLIQLYPPSRTSPHIIECGLVHTLLEYDWPWAAFSYTWSTFEEIEQQVKVHEKILLDGCWFEVTKNLYAALQTMRNHEATASQKVLFWIDAICINQSDIVERNKQVQMMGKIYSSAKHVCVWLGEDKTGDSQSAVEFLKSIGYSFFIREQRRLAQSCNPEMFELVGRSLCSRLWFQRIWVVQEVVLAAEGPGLIVGSNPNPSPMELLLEMAEEPNWIITVRDRPKAPDARGIVAAHAISKLRKWRRSMKPLKFKDLLILTRQFDSTVPHDKIYALRGLATDISEEDLTPDYAKPEAQLYTDVVWFCIRRYKSLNVICLVKNPRKIPVLPSWVPDFSIDSNSTIAADFTRGFWFTGNGPKAGGSSPCRVEQIVDDPNLLRAEGFCLDILDHVHHDPDTNKEFFTFLIFSDPVYRASRTSTTFGFEGELPGLFDVDNNSDCVADSVQFIGGPYVGGGTKEEAVARTWIGNTDEDWMEVHRGEALVFWRDSLKNVGPDFCMKLLQPRFVNFEDRYWFVHRRLATGRAPFIGRGGYIGWAPAEAQVGDMLVVLWGCDWPVVIRRDEQGYRFVGECYCHGVMNGEAVEVQREKGLELETFALI